MKVHPTAAVVIVLGLLTPTAADAHLVNSGLGPFYDGALHLILSPIDIVRLVTLCLFAAALGPSSGRAVVVAAPIAWLLASSVVLASGATTTTTIEILNAVSLILLGGAVAFNVKPPPLIAGAVAAGYAGFLGFQNGIELRSDNADWVALLGSTAVASAIMMLVTSFVVSATSFPARVACRVLGSWASATGLLSIGWLVAASR